MIRPSFSQVSDDDEDDRAAVADLELYGLPTRTINILEMHMGIIYIDQLRGVTREMLLERCGALGPKSLVTLRDALLRFFSGKPLYTTADLVRF